MLAVANGRGNDLSMMIIIVKSLNYNTNSTD